MFTVVERVRHRIDPVKGSRFVATVAPAASETAARAVLTEVSAELPDASHHCTAWRIARPAVDRCNDDGEPGGSAGRPILAQLTGRGLVNTVVVVTRYFGGTKLGVGGLVRAYGASAAAALDETVLTPYRPTVNVTVTVDYGDVDRAVRAIDSAPEPTELAGEPVYGQSVTLAVAVAEAELVAVRRLLADATSGRAEVSVVPLPTETSS